MFKNTAEVLDFIEKAKKAHIKAFKIGDIEVQFSDVALYESLAKVGEALPKTEEKNTSATLVDTLADQLAKEDEELLMWSSKT